MDVTVIAFIFGSPGLPEMLIVGAIMLLLFGKRLPEVARSLGKGIVEFKRGVRGIEDDVDGSNYAPSSSTPRPEADDNLDNVTAPKFEPPPPAAKSPADEE